jgi:hypothetical protein
MQNAFSALSASDSPTEYDLSALSSVISTFIAANIDNLSEDVQPIIKELPMMQKTLFKLQC